MKLDKIILDGGSTYQLNLDILDGSSLLISDAEGFNIIRLHLDSIDDLIKALKTFQTKGTLCD